MIEVITDFRPRGSGCLKAYGHSHAIAATARDDCRSAIRRLIDSEQETQTL